MSEEWDESEGTQPRNESEEQRLQRELEGANWMIESLKQQQQREKERLEKESEERKKQTAELARVDAYVENKWSQAVKRAQAAEKACFDLEQRLKVIRSEKKLLESKLQNEMRLSEEFRKLLKDSNPGNAKVFHQQVMEALQRVEQGIQEVVEDFDLRLCQKAEDQDEGFMQHLAPEVKDLCFRLERLVGGHGHKFAQLLLGSSVTLSVEDLEEEGRFFTSRKFWLCIKQWVEVSRKGGVPLTSGHLRQACRKLLVDPTKLTPITQVHERVLENNFKWLVDHLVVGGVMPHLRSSPAMTVDAWNFLLKAQGSMRRVDCLLAVVYSLGEEGYATFLSALDGQNHVLTHLNEYEKTLEAQENAAQQDEGRSAAAHAGSEDPQPAAGVPENADDYEELVERPLANFLLEITARLSKLEEEIARAGADAREVRESVAGWRAATKAAGGETARALSALQDEVRSFRVKLLEAVGGAMSTLAAKLEGLQGLVTEVNKSYTVLVKSKVEDVTTTLQLSKKGVPVCMVDSQPRPLPPSFLPTTPTSSSSTASASEGSQAGANWEMKYRVE